MTVKFGVLGAGRIGQVHAKAIASVPGATLVAVADPVEAAAQTVSKQYGCDIRTIDTIRTADDIDAVIICTPTNTHADLIEDFIKAGKAVFCEKPVAVDAPGVRSVLETTALAKEKDLSIVSGLCWRYDQGVRETIKRIQDGAIGDVTSMQENYLTGVLWHRGDKPEWSEMEYQFRNWYHFSWLSGDDIPQSLVHNLDSALWALHIYSTLSAIKSREGSEYNIPSCPIAIPSSIAMVLNSAAKKPCFSISPLIY